MQLCSWQNRKRRGLHCAFRNCHVEVFENARASVSSSVVLDRIPHNQGSVPGRGWQGRRQRRRIDASHVRMWEKIVLVVIFQFSRLQTSSAHSLNIRLSETLLFEPFGGVTERGELQISSSRLIRETPSGGPHHCFLNQLPSTISDWYLLSTANY